MQKTLTITAFTATLLTAIGGHALANEKAAENFMQADANADGSLTLQEFTTLIDLNAADGIGRAAMIKRMGRQSMAFGRIDQNSDGLISNDEISALAAKAKQ
ncbi:MAG: hypothetical protein AAFP68_12905 [Pseudomonadota bacterium]